MFPEIALYTGILSLTKQLKNLESVTYKGLLGKH